jgi:hypothetical protein
MNVWFRELGFFNNPFSIKPAIFSDKVVGYEEVVDEISYGILNKKMLFLEGEYGEGKSTILKRLVNDFGGKKQVIYYSCNRVESRLNVKKLLNGRYGFWGKLFDLKPKDMILLLDEAQELCKKDYSKLYSYFQEGYIKSIVFVGKEFDKKEIDEKIVELMKEVKLRKLSDDEAVKVVRRRIGSLPLLSDEVIKNVFNMSDNNIRVMLKNLESLCKHAVNYGETKISEELVKEILGGEKKVVKKESPKKVEKKAEPVKKVEKKVVKKKVVKKKSKDEESPNKDEKKQVYKPDQPLNIGRSSEEMLNKDTDELFDDNNQYY